MSIVANEVLMALSIIILMLFAGIWAMAFCVLSFLPERLWRKKRRIYPNGDRDNRQRGFYHIFADNFADNNRVCFSLTAHQAWDTII